MLAIPQERQARFPYTNGVMLNDLINKHLNWYIVTHQDIALCVKWISRFRRDWLRWQEIEKTKKEFYQIIH